MTLRDHKRVAPPLAALFAGGLLLTACSRGSHDAPSSSVPTTAPSTSTTTTTAPSTTTTAPSNPSSTSTTKPTTTTTTAASALAQAQDFTACMRAHGVPDFPEPTDTNGQISFSGTGGLGRTPDFQSAQQTCSLSIYGQAPTSGSSSA